MEIEKKVMKVQIGDRVYPLHIREGQEELMEKSVERLNERIREYSSQFKTADAQDWLAMAALEITSRYFELLRTEKENEDPNLVARLMEMDRFLAQHLQHY